MTETPSNTSTKFQQLRTDAAKEVHEQQDPESILRTQEGRKRRMEMTAREKADQNRDRNRQHARDTRKRKKIFLTKLESLADEYTAQKEHAKIARVEEVERIQRQYETRTHAVRSFLDIRSNGSGLNYDVWANIAEESIVLTQPVEPYRMRVLGHKTNESKYIQTLSGIPALVEDAKSFMKWERSIGNPWGQEFCTGCNMKEDDMIIKDDVCMAQWTWSTLDAVQKGCSGHELTNSGMLMGRFHPDSDKLVSLNIVFDVMLLMQSIQRFAAQSNQQEHRAFPFQASLSSNEDKNAHHSIGVVRNISVMPGTSLGRAECNLPQTQHKVFRDAIASRAAPMNHHIKMEQQPPASTIESQLSRRPSHFKRQNGFDVKTIAKLRSPESRQRSLVHKDAMLEDFSDVFAEPEDADPYMRDDWAVHGLEHQQQHLKQDHSSNQAVLQIKQEAAKRHVLPVKQPVRLDAGEEYATRILTGKRCVGEDYQSSATRPSFRSLPAKDGSRLYGLSEEEFLRRSELIANYT